MYNNTRILFFWVEASKKIATGHFKESLALAKFCIKKKINVNFIINYYEPVKNELIFNKIPFSTLEINEVEKVTSLIKKHSNNPVIIINHRNIELSSLIKLKKEKVKTIVIDQLGNKEVVCDMLINSSIIPNWLNYKFVGKAPDFLSGPKYAIFRDDFLKLNQTNKKFKKQIPKVLVTMGGVDRTGATIRILKALLTIKEKFNKEIILGNGFPHMKELNGLIDKEKIEMLDIYQGVDDLGKRMSGADIVISAGGNTVFELACVGTPGLVLWEDKHEEEQGNAFEEKGVVINLGNGSRTSIKSIAKSVQSLLDDSNKRKQMSNAGKELVNGKGKEYIFESFKEHLIYI